MGDNAASEVEVDDPFGIPDESPEEREAAIEAGMPDATAPAEPTEDEQDAEREASEAAAELDDEPASKAVESDAKEPQPIDPEKHEQGLRAEITRLRDQRQASETTLQQQLADLRAENEALKAKSVPRGTEDEEPALKGIELVPDEDGRLVLSDEILERIRKDAVADVRKQTEPSPEQIAHKEAADRFERVEAEFIGKNPELHGPAAARVREIANRTNLMSELLSMKAGGIDPGSADGWVKLFKDAGADKELEALYPEMGAFEPFMHSVFDPNPYHLANSWMPAYVERLAKALNPDPAPDDESEETREPKPKPDGMGAPKPLSAKKPRSIANQGEGATRDNPDDLTSELEAMHKIDLWDLTDEQIARMAKLEERLEKEGRVG